MRESLEMSHRNPAIPTGAALLALALAWAQPAAANTDPATTIKPLVLILLDTSGSMEYEAGTESSPGAEFTVPFCEEPGTTEPSLDLGTYAKSRLIVAKEVLTGGIHDYWCVYDHREDPDAEDHGYPIPHVQACSGDDGTGCNPPRRAFDGLLDSFRDQLKFGVMTFDSLLSPANNAEGMWSYGPNKGGINLGIRNARWGAPNLPNEWDDEAGDWAFADPDRSTNNRGQLIPPSQSDDFGPVRAANRLAQYEIESTIGFWGTPLAPMLDDTRHFLLNDPAVRPFDSASGTGDPYAACRQRTAVLITDGRASQGEGEGGYPTTPAAVEALKNTPPSPVKVYVVGFNLASEDETLLDDLDPENGGPADAVYRADTPGQLTEALTEIFNEVQFQVQSRTEVRYTNATRSSQDLQYQFNAGFQPDPDVPTNLIGFLDQTVFGCADCGDGLSCEQPDAYVPIHDRLNDDDVSDDDRNLFAILRGAVEDLDADLVDEVDEDELGPVLGIPQTGDLPRVRPMGFDDNDRPVMDPEPIGPASEEANQREYMEEVISLIRADDGSARQRARMGAITHATPVIQEAIPEGRHPLESWDLYVRGTEGAAYAPRCRPTILYTSTHDGLIHAFRVDRLATTCGDVPIQTDDDVGQEIWAITPQHLLAQSHSLVDGYRFLGDGALTLRDVLLRRGNPVGLDDEALEDEANLWASVLTVGYGAGGRGYTALDVTYALEGPEILWEIDHEQRCRAGACFDETDGAENAFDKMGLTTARAAYATIFHGGQEVSVAILPAGDSPEDTANPQAGRAVYVVDLATGEKIAELSNDASNVVDESGNPTTLPSPMTGSPSVFSDLPGVVSTRAFMGDAGGRMWRLDMRQDDPDDWELQLFHDPYASGEILEVTDDVNRQPVLGAPAIALQDAQGQLAVVYGTGDVDFLQASDVSRSGVFSVSEVIGSDGSATAVENWHVVLEPEEKLTGEALIFDRVAYFTTYVENATDACDDGAGRLYGVHFSEPDPDADDGDPNTSQPGLEDLDAAAGVLLDESFVTLEEEGVPLGVQVVERPACISTAASNQGTGGSGDGSKGVARGQVQLVTNVAGGPSTSAPGASPPTGQQRTRTQTRDLRTSGETLQSSAWGYVLY